VRAVAFATLLVASACGGYRQHAATEFDAGAPPECDADPLAAGCPCDAPAPVACYDGPPETYAVGHCRPGNRACTDGRWSVCAGQILPTEETCNDLDDDCDLAVDDGVLGPCGDCDPACSTIVYGHEPGEIPFDPESGDCVELRPPGDLVADPTTIARDLWVPSTVEGTISRIETRSREEIARYRTGPGGAGEEPSRTSVPYGVAAYVANRAPAGRSSVTRIESDCEDVDLDGRITTSTGRDDVLAWGTDECVTWSTEIGAEGARANALAGEVRIGLDGEVDERVWVGLATERRQIELDALGGAPTGIEVDLGACDLLGSAVDRDGGLWSVCAEGTLVRFDTVPAEEIETIDTPGAAAGIAIDWAGRIWVGGDVAVYDPADSSWTPFAGVTGAGMATDSGDDVWVGDCHRDGAPVGTCAIDAWDLDVTEVDAASTALSTDFDGYVWGVPASGTLDVIDPDDFSVETVLDDCAGPCLDGPDAYSDMTGFFLRSGIPTCSWQVVVEQCPEGQTTRWGMLSWEVDGGDDAGLLVSAATGRTLEELAAAPRVQLADTLTDTPPVDLGALLGEGAANPLLEIYALFISRSRSSEPVLHRLSIERDCD